MDSYLASGHLKDSNSFFFNLAFELLNGCPWQCKGCFVNKEGSEPMTDETYADLKNVMESFSAKNLYKPFIAFIQPVDFLSAGNTAEVLSDPRVIDILNYFKRISFQTTYLDTSNAQKIADVLKKHYSNMELEINIIIEPDQVQNNKYLKVLEKNQNEVVKIMDWPTGVRKFGIMNVYNYDTTKVADLIKNYDYLHTRVEHLFETTIDFNFSLGRKDALLSNNDFYEAAVQIKEMFNDSLVSAEKGSYLRFSFGKLNDSLIERQYNWKNGEFYHSPLLYERYVSFVDELKIPLKEFTASEFEEFEEQVQLDQYLNVDDKTECGNCEYLGSCVDRSILHLMDIHNVKDCLVAKNAIRVVNALGPVEYEI